MTILCSCFMNCMISCWWLCESFWWGCYGYCVVCCCSCPSRFIRLLMLIIWAFYCLIWLMSSWIWFSVFLSFFSIFAFSLIIFVTLNSFNLFQFRDAEMDIKLYIKNTYHLLVVSRTNYIFPWGLRFIA